MGIQTPTELRQTRDTAITDYQGAILWALHIKPGVTPINGSAKRQQRVALARLLAIHRRKARQINPRAKLGRFTLGRAR